MNITTIGIDLAKSCIQVHCVDVHGKRILNKKLKREQVVPFFSNRPACLIGMEACGSAHFWANKLQAQGHTVKLMAPQFVKPYVKTNKNDAVDAEAICEAVSRPNMRFVPLKNSEQLAVLAMHRARQGFVKARTAQANQLRGLLAEHGIIIPKGIRHINQHLPDILEAGDNGLPGRFRQLLDRLSAHFKELDKQVRELDIQLQSWHQDSPASQKLAKIPGIGPLTASALVATIGDAKQFQNGRQLAAWLGLVPRQHSSGGKPTLLGISKRGDTYLRTLLIHGARAVLRVVKSKAQHAGSWLEGVMARRNHNVAAVAQANKTARIVWALLANDREFDAQYGTGTILAA